MINAVRPDCNVLEMGMFTEDLAQDLRLGEVIKWIVVTTDTVASRQSIHNWAYNIAGIRYIEAAAEGEYGSCTGEPAEWSTPEEIQPGYASVPVWVGPCVFAAAAAVDHVIHNHNIGYRAVRIGWQKALPGEQEGFVMYDSTIAEETEEEQTASL